MLLAAMDLLEYDARNDQICNKCSSQKITLVKVCSHQSDSLGCVACTDLNKIKTKRFDSRRPFKPRHWVCCTLYKYKITFSDDQRQLFLFFYQEIMQRLFSSGRRNHYEIMGNFGCSLLTINNLFPSLVARLAKDGKISYIY